MNYEEIQVSLDMDIVGVYTRPRSEKTIPAVFVKNEYFCPQITDLKSPLFNGLCLTFVSPTANFSD